jgi:hypothetical protein
MNPVPRVPCRRGSVAVVRAWLLCARDYGVRSTARTGEPSAPRSFSGSAISS